ncbi:hypothetical protein [Noviherbaspirillum galbum]|uniref:Uncharacterized protein n=1 Tax=Noviherbaspirillum galbum TaxID=2709383 RepID=A0A6B3SUG4_9BURK|nr:hypothetical protein [Noviherbaspirillum galbum]NEX64231.1 hypothetical protein [Noviherbaspirillum galbum]
MNEQEIFAYITSTETEDVHPRSVARAYAATINELQSRISEQELQRLLLLGAAMYKNSVSDEHKALQMPASLKPSTELNADDASDIVH